MVSYPDSFSANSHVIFFAATVAGRGRTTEGTSSERHIPFSGDNILDLGGRKTTTLRFTLLLPNGAALFDPAGPTGLETLVDTQGTFTWHEATATVVLKSISGGRWWQSDQQEAAAEFWLVAETSGLAAAAPVAGFAYGVSGLDVALDVNQGSSTTDSLVDVVNVEFGDGATQTLIGPYDLSALAIPIVNHSYASPAAYVVTVSIERSSVLSADTSKLITVGSP